MLKRNRYEFLGGSPLNNDNLHLIAISNLKNYHRRITRWWSKKYKIPVKPFQDHTWEELLIEMLEDFYDQHPHEAERIMNDVHVTGDDDWDGSMPVYYEKAIAKTLGKFFEKNKTDLSKWQSEDETSKEDDERMISNLGRRLKGSNMTTEGPKQKETEIATIGDEFEDDFEV